MDRTAGVPGSAVPQAVSRTVALAPAVAWRADRGQPLLLAALARSDRRQISESEARAQLDTNLFGALWVTQAALPLLRAQRAGHIVQVSSISGVGAFPNVGMYAASKWALETFSQSLAQEVAQFTASRPRKPGGSAMPCRAIRSRHGTPYRRS
ncbi:SDR family NAD(P)-dependent oxidoreductase [Streptomyces griseochromogenes]|uniref:Uncharacterized protein n=1 Tax=Streptomyces griseochromogenes TaxID=68214 RepID=A0A1B1AU11_9ACTN|nr:SDR family NAD(P)-dependent oxidoreductase [Streptomyces griseochromogenes]ANP50031.1 hypothetical protein AVL59_10785 [Streptomyces griseochromogenes]